jgi:hypothetical protein
MKRFVMAAAAALLVAGSAPAFAQARERVTAPVGGISIEKPTGWFTVPPGDAIANLRKVEFDSPAFQQRLQQAASEPLIVFTKYPVSHPGLIPTIKVNYRRIPDNKRIGAVGVLNAVIDAMRQGFGTVDILDAPTETRVGGLPAAHMRVAYVMTSQGEKLSAVSEMWMIPRGDYVLIVGVAYSPDEPAPVRDEILAAVGSVQIAAQ